MGRHQIIRRDIVGDAKAGQLIEQYPGTDATVRTALWRSGASILCVLIATVGSSVDD